MAALHAASTFVKCDAFSRFFVQTSELSSWQAKRKSATPMLVSPLKGMPLKGIPTLRMGPRNARPVVLAKHYLVEKVTGDELHEILDGERKFPFVVDFYATWCGPCIQLAQDLEMLAVEFGSNVKFIKVDTDEEWELAKRLQIRGLPTILFVSKDTGKNISRVEGVTSMELMRNIIQNEL